MKTNRHAATSRRLKYAACAFAVAAFAGKTFAQQTLIGANFIGRNDNQYLGSGESAGILVQQNWNNLDGAFSFGGAGSATSGDLNHSGGVASGVTLTVSANDSWNSNTNATLSSDHKMMKGIIKAAGVGNSSTFQWNNLSPNKIYEVIGYTSMNGDGGRGDFSLTAGGTHETYYGTVASAYDGTFTKATAVSAAARTANMDYVQWQEVRADGSNNIRLNMRYDGGADGVGMSGVQLLAVDEVTWAGDFSNVWDVNTTANFDGLTFLNGQAATFDDSAAVKNVTIAAGGVTPYRVLINNTTGNDYTIDNSTGSIGGTGYLLKRGNGLATLTGTGTNTFTGDVRVEGGTLAVNSFAGQLGGGSQVVLGSLTGSSGTISYAGNVNESTNRNLLVNSGGGGFNVQNNVTLTFNGSLSGSGDLSKTGIGTLSLTGSSSGHTGQVIVNDGTLKLGGAQGGAVQLNTATGSLEYSGNVSSIGAGSLNTSGAGGTINVSDAAGNVVLLGSATFNGPATKTGPGRLAINGKATFNSAPTISAGTLALTNDQSGGNGNVITGNITVGSGAGLEVVTNSLGTAGVTLAGGTLSVGTKPGLLGSYYNQTPAQASFAGNLAAINAHFAGLTPAVTANTLTNGRQNLDFNNGNGGGGALFADQGFGSVDNVEAKWSGFFTADAAGTYNFATRSDDGSVLFIDGVKVVDNNFFQGMTQRGGSINLSQGRHTIDLFFYEGGGGAGVEFKVTAPGGSEQIISNANLSVAGLFNGTNTVNVTASSTIDPVGTSATFGTLALDPVALLTKAGNVTFTGTALNGAGTYSLTKETGDLVLGGISGTNAGVTIEKSGAGNVVLNNPNVGQLGGAGNTVRINQGSLYSIDNALGAATVDFNGGILTLSSSAGPINFTTPYTLTTDGGIEARAAYGGLSGETVNLTANLAIPAGRTFSIGAHDGYVINVGGTASGTGTAKFTGGQINVANSNSVNGLNLVLAPSNQANPVQLGIASTAVSAASLAGVGTGPGNVTIGTGSGSSVLTLNQDTDTIFLGNVNQATGSTGSIVKNGTGKISLGGVGNIAGGLTVSNGTVEILNNGAGSGTINAAGGTLQFASSGLTGNYYNTNPGLETGFENLATWNARVAQQAPSVTALTTTGGRTNLDFNNNNGSDQSGPFADQGFGNLDNIIANWTGRIYIAQAGIYNFDSTSDDGSMVWIDGVNVVNNNFYQGMTTRGGSANLTAGWHDLQLGFYEGGGGAGVFFRMAADGGVPTIITNQNIYSSDLYTSANAHNLSASSTYDTRGGTVNLGALSWGAGTTLTQTAGRLNWTSTTFANAGTYTLNNTGTMSTGDLADGGNNITINKNGTGELIINGTTQLTGDSVINANTGATTLIGSSTNNPLGISSVNIGAGATLRLSSSSGNAAFENPTTLIGSATIEAGNFGNGGVNNVGVSWDDTVTIPAASTLTTKSSNGYTLTYGSTVGGPGNVAITGGTIVTNGTFSPAQVFVNQGTLRTTAFSTLGSSGGVTVNNSATLALNGGVVTADVNSNGGTIIAESGVNDIGGSLTIIGHNPNTTNNALGAVLYNRVGLNLNTEAGINAVFNETPDATRSLTSALDFGPLYGADGAFSAFFSPTGVNDAFTAGFAGNYTATTTGAASFGYRMNDDNALLWLDLNQNGIFESNGSAGSELLVSTGCCDNGVDTTVNLVAGQSYRFALALEDTGGGSSIRGQVTPNGGIFSTIDPSDIAQNGLWSVDQPTGGATLRALSNAELRVANADGAQRIELEGNNAKITVNSGGGSFSEVNSISVSGGSTGTLNTTANNDILVSHLSVGPGATLTKEGPGQVTATSQSIGNGGLLQIEGGEIILQGAAIASNGAANNGGVVINNGGTLNMEQVGLIRASISGGVTINNGGTLKGGGIVGAVTLNPGGNLSPGASPGILDVGNTNFAGGNFNLELNSATPGTGHDQLNVTGTVTLSSLTPITISLGFAPADNTQFVIVNNDDTDLVDTTLGLFTIGGNPIADGGVFEASGQLFNLYYNAGSGNDVLLVAVPEPSSALALMGGLGVLLGLQRRRRRS